MNAAPAIGFHYRSSRMLVILMLAVAMLAFLAVWTSAAPEWLRLALSLAIAVYAGAVAARQLRPRVRSVLWRADGDVELTLDDDMAASRREVHGAIHAVRVMGPLIVLTLRWPPRAHATLWLLPDNLDADTRRRLRMRLGAPLHTKTVSGNADSG